MSDIKVSISVFVNPTENPEKVMLAVSNIFGNLEYVIEDRDEGYLISARNTGIQALGLFRDIISRMRIRDACRSFFERISQDDSLSFGLNKQAAYARAVSFHQEGDSPLGPIQVFIKGDTTDIINFLCGKPPVQLF